MNIDVNSSLSECFVRFLNAKKKTETLSRLKTCTFFNEFVVEKAIRDRSQGYVIVKEISCEFHAKIRLRKSRLNFISKSCIQYNAYNNLNVLVEFFRENSMTINDITLQCDVSVINKWENVFNHFTTEYTYFSEINVFS